MTSYTKNLVTYAALSTSAMLAASITANALYHRRRRAALQHMENAIDAGVLNLAPSSDVVEAGSNTVAIEYEKLLTNVRLIREPKYFESARNTKPHAHEAYHRSNLQTQMVNAINKSGRVPYSIGRGKREDALFGCTGFKFPQDFTAHTETNPVPTNACFLMIDVDYYVDMNELLMTRKPVLIYTFAPSSPTGRVGNTTWCIKDGKIHSTAVGSQTFSHELWDYNGEFLSLNLVNHTLVVRVDVFGVGLERNIVLLSPTALIPTMRPRIEPTGFSMLGDTIIHMTNLWRDALRWLRTGRLDAHVFTDSRLKRLTTTAPLVWMRDGVAQIVCADSHPTVKLPSDLWFSLLVRQAISATSLRIGEIKQYIGDYDTGHEPGIAAPLLSRALCITQEPAFTPTVRQAGPDYDAPSKPTTRMLRDVPIAAAGAFIHSKGPNEERVSIFARVTRVANKAVVPQKYYDYLDEFLLCLPADETCPLTTEEVIALLNTANQVRRLDRHQNSWNDKNVVAQSFIKANPEAKVSTPRNITTLADDNQCEYGRYTIPLSKLLARSTHWYAFSRTPMETVTTLHNTVTNWPVADKIIGVENDYSTWDGTNGCFQSVVIQRVFDKYFPNDSKITEEFVRCRIDPPAFTDSGIAYSTGFSMMSGSKDTSLRNTVNNCFVAFCCLREAGMPPVTAYDNLGFYGGDDGFDHPAIADTIVPTTTELGLIAKPIVRRVGDEITFLGRVFPDIKTCYDSFSDPRRHLPKLHITHINDPTVSTGTILHNKASGFLATDPTTPLLTDWACYVTRHYSRTGTTLPHTYWATKCVEAGPFPSLDPVKALDYVSSLLGVSVDELKRMREQMQTEGRCTDEHGKLFDFGGPMKNVGDVFVNEMFVPGTAADNAAIASDPPNRQTKQRRATFDKDLTMSRYNTTDTSSLAEKDEVPEVLEGVKCGTHEYPTFMAAYDPTPPEPVTGPAKPAPAAKTAAQAAPAAPAAKPKPVTQVPGPAPKPLTASVAKTPTVAKAVIHAQPKIANVPASAAYKVARRNRTRARSITHKHTQSPPATNSAPNATVPTPSSRKAAPKTATPTSVKSAPR